jgi:hypothetical protein
MLARVMRGAASFMRNRICLLRILFVYGSAAGDSWVQFHELGIEGIT